MIVSLIFIFLIIIFVQYPLFQNIGYKKYTLFLSIILSLFIVYFLVGVPILDNNSKDKLPVYVIYFVLIILPLLVIFSISKIILLIYLYKKKEKKLFVRGLIILILCVISIIASSYITECFFGNK